MMDRYLNLDQLAEYANRSKRSLRELIRRGELQAFRTAPRGRIQVRSSWYDAYVETKLKTDTQSVSRSKTPARLVAEDWLREIATEEVA